MIWLKWHKHRLVQFESCLFKWPLMSCLVIISAVELDYAFVAVICHLLFFLGSRSICIIDWLHSVLDDFERFKKILKLLKRFHKDQRVIIMFRESLKDPKLWVAAASQVLISLHVSCGLTLTLSSRSRNHGHIIR